MNTDKILEAAIDLQQAYGWRLGQSVFNLLDTAQYGHVARIVQENYDIDCFYDDDKIDEFLKWADMERVKQGS